ncbi:hypothetical protein MRX96_042454 [Rhipicephalus microplus]
MQARPLSLPSGPSSHEAWWRPRIDGSWTTPPLDIEAALPSPSISAAPLQFTWALGHRQASAVGGDGGAVFRNVLPGVLVFKWLRVTEINIEGNAVTSHFVEEATGRTVQITSATVFGAMTRNQLDPFLRRLSEQFGSTGGTIAVAFPRNQDEALGELEAFERCFPSVPALAQPGHRVQRGRSVRADEPAQSSYCCCSSSCSTEPTPAPSGTLAAESNAKLRRRLCNNVVNYF